MTSRLDHIVVLAHSLAAGADLVENALGLRPGPGRKHPHMGTHNLLLALGTSVYLEVVAVDPDAPPVARPRWFGLDTLPARPAARLAAWVASTDDIASDACPELGAVETMGREGRTWQMTSAADGRLPLDGAGPLLIQRATPVHPAAVLPESKLSLRALHIAHPAPAQASALLARINLAAQPKVTVAHGASCSLVAEIETPSGPRLLGTA
jgi:hypothetical protein